MAQSRLIQFTEMLKWSPDVRFTEPERAELERLAVDEKTAAGLSKAQNIQRALSPEKWDQVRAEVEDGMLKSLRESPEEATSRLLL